MHLEERDEALPVERQLAALLEDGHSRTRATELVIESAVADARDAPTVVLVEGVSDQIAVEVVAARLGRRLRDEGVAVVPMGGATNIGRFAGLFAGRRLAGLYDVAEENHVMGRLAEAGVGGGLFFACVKDLEDELIRSIGLPGVEAVIEGQGELRSFRTMQNEPFHRGRSHEQQLHRFIGRDRYRYARLLTEALDATRLPAPLDALLRHL